MSSSVFFKFKSQKEPTRVEFDGTGISVFELKRDIIIKSGLGDGTDFDLAIYSEDGSEEYDDDTTIIQRSTTVMARRLPALKPGAGRAARYISGKMPVSAKNSSRREQSHKATASAKATSNALTQMSNAMTEEEKMAAMFQAQTESWSAQQEEMAHAPATFNSNNAKSRKPANVPDHEPPNGYICYRCGEKGHWIQLCPTNDDPEFNNRPRVKRTTGIPKAFLKTVDKAVIMAQAGDDDSKRPSGIMVNADGDFVIAETDKKAWERYQALTKSSAAIAKDCALEDGEAVERGLVCSIDQKLFIDPMKTPCCEKTYCNECITNALIESDFVCSACKTEGVLIDDLVQDGETADKVKEYLKEKEEAKSPAPAAASPPATTSEQKEEAVVPEKPKSPTPMASETKSPKEPEKKKSPSTTPITTKSQPAVADDVNPKKRPAEDVLENPKIPKGPKAMQKQLEQQQQQQQQQQQMQNPQAFMNPMMNGVGGMPMMPPMPMMPFGGMNMMPPMMGMPNMGMVNPMMMNPMMGMPGFNNNGGGGNAMFPGFDMSGGMNGMGGGMSANGNGNFHNGGFPNQFNNFGQGEGGGDDAYFRKPVNPHRHQNRQKRVRPSDYREL